MYRPDASWSVGGAMGRNKLIHGFGEYTVTIRSGDETGGTWEGATENLSNDWSSLLVCTHHEDAPGNEKLISMGGIGIDPESIPVESSFHDWVEQQISSDENDQSNDNPSSNSDSTQDQNRNDQTSLEEF